MRAARTPEERQRAAIHLALTLPTLVACTHCHEPKLQYRVCPACGWYNGREAVALKPAGASAAGEDSK